MKIIAQILGLLLLLLSCSDNNAASEISEDQNPAVIFPEDILNRYTEDEVFTEAEIQITRAIEFAQVIDWQGQAQSLYYDAFFPKLDNEGEDEVNRPVVVLFFGGGFSTGSRESLERECIAFAKRGFVAITADYRVGWNTGVEQLEAIYRANQDARAALRYIVNTQEDLGIDVNFIFVGGNSAGSVNAFNLVYATQSEWNSVLPGIEANLGELDSNGNTLTNTYQVKALFNNWGAALSQVIDSEEHVPMIAFHGELDKTVPIDTNDSGLTGSRSIYNLLVKNNVCADLSVIPDGGHGDFYRDESGAAFRVSRASCFFKSLMDGNCASFYTEEEVAANCSDN